MKSTKKTDTARRCRKYNVQVLQQIVYHITTRHKKTRSNFQPCWLRHKVGIGGLLHKNTECKKTSLSNSAPYDCTDNSHLTLKNIWIHMSSQFTHIPIYILLYWTYSNITMKFTTQRTYLCQCVTIKFKKLFNNNQCVVLSNH